MWRAGLLITATEYRQKSVDEIKQVNIDKYLAMYDQL